MGTVRPQISQYICPDDSVRLSSMSAPAPLLSYMVNGNVMLDRSGCTTSPCVRDRTSRGTDGDGCADGQAADAHAWGMGQRQIRINYGQLGKRLGHHASTNSTAFHHAKFPVAPNTSNPLAQYTTPRGGHVKSDPLVPANTPAKNYFSSNHRGIIIVVFFDGHGERLSETIDCSVYLPQNAVGRRVGISTIASVVAVQLPPRATVPKLRTRGVSVQSAAARAVAKSARAKRIGAAVPLLPLASQDQQTPGGYCPFGLAGM